jgi:hypothetical protein
MSIVTETPALIVVSPTVHLRTEIRLQIVLSALYTCSYLINIIIHLLNRQLNLLFLVFESSHELAIRRDCSHVHSSDQRRLPCFGISSLPWYRFYNRLITVHSPLVTSRPSSFQLFYIKDSTETLMLDVFE